MGKNNKKNVLTSLIHQRSNIEALVVSLVFVY